MITRSIGSRVSRSMASAKFKDGNSTQPKTRPPKYVKILIPGDDNVMWRQKVTKRYAVFVKVEDKKRSRDQRSVLAGEDMPFGALVTFYRGRFMKRASIGKNTHWITTVPGLRGFYVLDSQITGEWSWPASWVRYVEEAAVGGFLNSSRESPDSNSNPKGANCLMDWFREFYDSSNIGENGSNVFAALIIKKRDGVKKGDKLVWDYPWK